MTGKLLADLFEMVGVNVGIAESMDEIARLQAANLRHHHREQRVTRDVERDTEEAVGATLVKLARKFSVGHVELEKCVAWGKIHPVEIGDIPSGNDYTAGVGIIPDIIYGARNLVDVTAIIVRPRAPLVAVNMTQRAIGVSPFVPDADSVILEILHVGVAIEEPKKFVYYTFEVNFLGGHQRKSIFQIKSHLVSESGYSAGTGSVVLSNSVVKDMTEKIQILFHKKKIKGIYFI